MNTLDREQQKHALIETLMDEGLTAEQAVKFAEEEFAMEAAMSHALLKLNTGSKEIPCP